MPVYFAHVYGLEENIEIIFNDIWLDAWEVYTLDGEMYFNNID